MPNSFIRWIIISKYVLSINSYPCPQFIFIHIKVCWSEQRKISLFSISPLFLLFLFSLPSFFPLFIPAFPLADSFLRLWHGMFFCNMTRIRVWWAVAPSQTRQIQPGAGAKESVRGVWMLRGSRLGAQVIFVLSQVWAPPTKEITMSHLPFPRPSLYYRTDEAGHIALWGFADGQCEFGHRLLQDWLIGLGAGVSSGLRNIPTQCITYLLLS